MRFAWRLGCLLALLLIADPNSVHQSTAAGEDRARTVVQISERAPGMRGPSTDSLQFPVPRTFELTHVDPAHFASALGRDPARIFEFVRDRIAYEVYTGCLRGSRGTLMAMVGNSVDRAVLLATLLEQSGHRVRYARGKLPEARTKELVASMWAERPRPKAPQSTSDPSASLKATLDTFGAGVRRDYRLIREYLEKAERPGARDTGIGLDALAHEARAHYWVQWLRNGAWVNIDPSFGDATPGRAHTELDEAFDALPETLFHRVTLRIWVEEYTGSTPSSREILSYTAKAAELSGTDLVLTHRPEKWTGPTENLQTGLSSAIENTGRTKPVLVVGEQRWVAGQPFRQRPPGRGIGEIGDLLGGAGTRKAVPIATAEWIELEFVAPGGLKQTVIREIFDVVGRARRAAGKRLGADEVRGRTEAKPDVTEGVYSVFLTTGGIDAAHLSNLPVDRPAATGEPPDIGAFLRRINVAFAATADALLPRVGRPERAVIRFYLDSPRVQIAELSVAAQAPRISLDLRRDHARAVAIGPKLEDVFTSRLLRGVVNGTLERSLMEYVTASARKEKRAPVVSTSSVSERAQAEGVPMVLLTRETASLHPGISDDTRARVREEMASGYWAVAPERAIGLGKEMRYAWWRIDPRSGETIAVTDEGLHQTSTEVHIERQGVTVRVRVIRDYGRLSSVTDQEFVHGSREYYEFLWRLLERGARFPQFPG